MPVLACSTLFMGHRECVEYLIDTFDCAGIDEENQHGFTPFSIALTVSESSDPIRCRVS